MFNKSSNKLTGLIFKTWKRYNNNKYNHGKHILSSFSTTSTSFNTILNVQNNFHVNKYSVFSNNTALNNVNNTYFSTLSTLKNNNNNNNNMIKYSMNTNNNTSSSYHLIKRNYSASDNNASNSAFFPSEAEYDLKAEYFLEDLSSMLDELDDYFDDLDIDYSQGVLTMHLGDGHGTYVLNKQRPNQQIWFSSPTSGPKRFEFNFETMRWVSTRNGEDLIELLHNELMDINSTINVELETVYDDA